MWKDAVGSMDGRATSTEVAKAAKITTLKMTA